MLVALGVYAVIAPSYNGLYFRNAFNVGLLLLTCAHATSLAEGERVVIDEHAQPWTVQGTDAPALACEPVPDFLLQRVRKGGLLNELKHRLARKTTDDA